MKKILALVVSCFGIFLVSNAQQGWVIGDGASFGHSWITEKPSGTKTKFHPSFQLGRKAIYQFNSNAGLGLGTFFSSEGGSWETKSLSANTSFRVNYIKIPLIADFHFGRASAKVKPHFAFGPSISFLVGGKKLTEISDLYAGAQSKKLIKTDIDAGVHATFGLSSKLWNGVFIHHDISYYHGFMDQELESGGNFQNRGFNAIMGITVSKDAFRSMKRKPSNNKFEYRYKEVPNKRKNVIIRKN